MICEDEPVIAMHIAAEVESCDCEVVGPFAHARDAMSVLRMQHIDAAILDIELADGASTPLARALREAGVRVIVLSGLHTASPPPEFAGLEWLVKPADERRLRAFCEGVTTRGLPHAASVAKAAGTSAPPGDLLR